MLLELEVRDLALIREASVSFTEGLNVLTGETGAGKSIVIGSISLALGKKAQPELVREGAEYAYMELVARPEEPALAEALREKDISLQEDGTVLITRRIGANRSQAKVNGEAVTLSELRGAAELLIDLYGQHEHEMLRDEKKHLAILDDYAHAEIGDILAETAERYRAYRERVRERDSFQADESARLREAEFLSYEMKEIDEANVRDGEEEELSAQYRRMSHAKTIAERLADAYECLSESRVSEALSSVEAALSYDEGLSGIRDQLYDADSIVSGAAHDIRSYADSLDMDEESFRRTEERLDLIRGLMAKYGKTAEAIRACRAEKEKRLAVLAHYEENKKQAEEACAEAQRRLRESCAALTDKRRKAAERLCAQMVGECEDLGFSAVRFSLSFQEKEPSADGADRVCFMASLNPGEPERPLAEAASGGELSRIMLALKTVLAETDRTPTLIFDEIDTGISGRTAQKVAEKLSAIAKRHQVICITHLPQIAAMADTHFLIEKSERDGRSVTAIRRLADEESLSELARLLGGAEITDAVRKNAAEMKELARKRKAGLA